MSHPCASVQYSSQNCGNMNSAALCAGSMNLLLTFGLENHIGVTNNQHTLLCLHFLPVFTILTQCVFAFVQSGDIEIVNHRTRDTCQLKFSPYSYFSKDVPRKVNASTLMPGAIMMSYITYLN